MSEPAVNYLLPAVEFAVKYGPLLSPAILGGVAYLGRKFNKIEAHLARLNGTIAEHNKAIAENTVSITEIHRSGDQCRYNVHREIDGIREDLKEIKQGGVL